MPLRKLLPFSAIAIALVVAACVTAAPSARVSRVVSTTSFGMCAGYCTTRLEITEGRVVLVREARGGRGAPDLPTQRFEAALTPAEWQEIQSLAGQTDLHALPDVVGCPDCADGGAEGLTIESGGGSESVSFDHGANLPPAQPLLDRVRALREQLTPEG